MLAASGACLGAILVAALAPAGPAMVALPLLGLAVACIWPTALAYTADRLPRAGATVYSLLGAAGNAGGALAPGFIGLVAQGHGLRQGIAAAALFPLAAALLMTWRAVVEKGEGAG
jgi:fucose permease